MINLILKLRGIIMRILAVIFPKLFLIVGLVSFCEGQTKTAILSGTVQDSYGAAIPGARVFLLRKGEQLPQARHSTTDAEGNYQFSEIGFGEYELVIKASWISREFKKKVILTSTKPIQTNFIVELGPCSDEEIIGAQEKLTEADKTEIAQVIFDIEFGKTTRLAKVEEVKMVFSDENLKPIWLRADQRSRIVILTHTLIQDRAEENGELKYYSFSKMRRKGDCVDVSLYNNLALRGQIENANLGGGATLYEVRKINGRWIGLALSTVIS